MIFIVALYYVFMFNIVRHTTTSMATTTSIQHPQQPPPPPPKPKANMQNCNSHENTCVRSSSEINTVRKGNQSYDSASKLDEEKVVMTPKGKTSNSTVILIERKMIDHINERQHVAGGDHTGIIINKDTVGQEKLQVAEHQPQLSLEFRVFLISSNTGRHSQEARTLRFWFRPSISNQEKKAHVAQDFFRELVSPKKFPRGK